MHVTCFGTAQGQFLQVVAHQVEKREGPVASDSRNATDQIDLFVTSAAVEKRGGPATANELKGLDGRLGVSGSWGPG